MKSFLVKALLIGVIIAVNVLAVRGLRDLNEKRVTEIFQAGVARGFQNAAKLCDSNQ